MLQWLPYPMVRVSLAFAGGIIFGLETSVELPELEAWWAALFVVYLLVLKSSKSSHNRWYSCLFLMAFVLLFLCGITRSRSNLHQPDESIGVSDYFQAIVVEPTIQKGRYHRTVLAISRVWSQAVGSTVNDRALWYQDSSNAIILSYGSEILLKGTPTAIQPPANPREFDYAGYMAQANVFWNFWGDQGHIVYYLSNNSSSLPGWAFQTREYLKSKIMDHLAAGIPQEISMAMLLGDRAAVSDHLEDSFARSGTIHVLAVSGLHLGILYWMVLTVLGSWRQHRGFKWLFLAISLTVLWAFTLITGMAPSTQRAASMFSILILANTFTKQSNTINTLAVSGFVILWADPYQLYSVGFQLSFLALTGILLLQPWFASLFRIQNRLVRYFWELASVSLSAQVAVLPLSAYYFHQLPVYFLLSNLVLVPLAFAIVVLGVLFFLSSLAPPLMTIIAVPLNNLANLAGLIVQTVAALPISTVPNIYINEYELLIWYVVLLSMIIFIKTRSRLPWLICLLLLSGMTLKTVFDRFIAAGRELIVIYHIPGHSAIDFIDGGYFQSMMNRELAVDTSAVNYKIRNYHNYLHLEPMHQPVSPYPENQSMGIWQFKGKRLLLINAPITAIIGRNVELKSHIVVVSNNSIDDLESILSSIAFDLLVIDGSNTQTQAKKLERQASRHGLKVHNCWEDGYRIIKL